MPLLYTSHNDLNEFRKKGKSKEITKFKKEILNLIPLELRNEIKEEELVLDYATSDLEDIPDEHIPYRFILKPKEIRINEFLEKYIILVNWGKE